MKKGIVFTCFFLIMYAAQAQDSSRIKAILEKQRLAWNRGDLETFMQTYWQSDSLLFVGSGGPTYGWTSTLQQYRQSYPDRDAMGELTFDIKQVKLIDRRNAFVLGAWNLKRKNDEPNGFFTLWLRKIKGDWFIVVDHSS